MISIAVKISFIFLILALLCLILIILYRPVQNNQVCKVTADCSEGAFCIHPSGEHSFCSELQCFTNNDCPDPSVCVNSYCYPYACITSNDCPITGTACIHGRCLPIGTVCTQNNDCGPLACRNGICVQCTENSDCPLGSICINNICIYGDQSPPGNQILYLSNANFNGNVRAPAGYYCSTSLCGQPDQPNTPYDCSRDHNCTGTCPYCVSSVCRCVPGALYESCAQNSDCSSGLCADTERGRICVPEGGQCAFNYNERGGQGTCTNPHMPYCVAGICSATSEGALCGSSSDPPDLCVNLGSLTISSKTDGMGFFCVNGRCQTQAGTLNDLCSGNSCQYIESGTFVCEGNRCVKH